MAPRDRASPRWLKYLRAGYQQLRRDKNRGGNFAKFGR